VPILLDAVRHNPGDGGLNAPAVTREGVARRTARSRDVKVGPLHAVLDETLDERSGRVRAARPGSHVLDVALWVLKLLAEVTRSLSERVYL
jgi:hypothetical protein